MTFKEVKDIIDCIVKYDDTASIEEKGRYFEVIQKDLRKVITVDNKVLVYNLTDLEHNKSIFNNCEIKIFDKNSLCIQNQEYMFAYNQPDSIVKNEFKGMYRNFGGLQSGYMEDSPEYEELYNILLDYSEKLLNLLYENN